jgi:hypothetical protein
MPLWPPTRRQGRQAKAPARRLSCLGNSQSLTLMVVEWCGSVVLSEGRQMDTRRSYYLHSKQDDFAEPPADASRLDFDDIPFIIPANDNLRTKYSLSARCGSLLGRLFAPEILSWLD